MEQRVGYLVKRVQLGLRARMDEFLTAQGLTTPQYAVLSALERSPGVSNAELARLSFVTPQTMIRILANLEEAGHITREQHPTHGRILQVTLTPKGRRLVASCHEGVTRIEEQMLSLLKKAEQQTLGKLLEKCVEGLGAAEVEDEG
jgi:DNA-binding MarR family transcriptional regulator